MRKNLFSFFALALVISLASCGGKGGGFEGDVRKMANYRCELQKLMAMDQADEKTQKKVADLQKEMGEFADKMGKKYEDKKDDKAMEEKAEKIMDEVMEKCK
ncbi:MAG: hypothetical protein HOP10_12830 [Chitinophagaceae bacterium]|nr:hypothetical protein [Chitinophagaceae bacterium]